ncbi:MAG: phosphogluconate dehydratase [Acidobacteriaceae bacterium]
MNSRVEEITNRIVERSRTTRTRYLDAIAAAASVTPKRQGLGCANQAHGFAACGQQDKAVLREGNAGNVAIVTAYNDMLSAHQPYERFPEIIRTAAREAGGVAQVAGGVPAMCDGITQGETGMELSLFSRDVIAMAAAVALSHQTFDAVVMLGICDKIVPGMLMAALSFGHLPAVFLPSGPMTSGYSNDDRKHLRQQHAEGLVSSEELMDGEAKSYHGPGTCTFYGTANTNQMMMEMMGLHLPGSSFVNANTPLRDALTKAAVRRALAMTALGKEYTPVGRMLDERVFVNGIVGLLATGGSTNHTIHLIAMAAAAGIRLEWGDFAALANVVPLLVRVYPNGKADVNHFHAAGGMGFLIGELLDAGLAHENVMTVAGAGLQRYTEVAYLKPKEAKEGKLEAGWRIGSSVSDDLQILRPVSAPFDVHGGLSVLEGNLGKAIVKTSAIAPDRHVMEGEIRIFHGQEEMLRAFKAGELHRDVIVVVRFQGPKANGMPELHKLLPPLQAVQGHGFKVALLTDGRLSGASGDVLAAIHLTPEATEGGPIAKLRDGDRVRIDANSGELTALVDAAEWERREAVCADLTAQQFGVGRELFSVFRKTVSASDQGGTVFGDVLRYC